MAFQFFDPDGDLSVRNGHLPHWFQPAATYFVTFRTDDSVPAALGRDWFRRRNNWLVEHGIDPTGLWKRQLESLPDADRRQYHTTFTDEFMEYLDRGMGSCPLRRPELAAVVAQSLHHFNSERYHLGDFVVMPNHVHVLVRLLGATDIEKLCYSWKKYTATRINKCLSQSGRLWQEESFDHLVRHAGQFEALKVYIAENPKRAGLVEGEFIHYVRPIAK